MNLDDPALLERAAKVAARAGQIKRAYAGNAGGGYYSTVGLSPYQRYLARMYRDPRLMLRDPGGRPVQEWGLDFGQALGETLRGIPRMLAAPIEGAFRGRHEYPGYFSGWQNQSGLANVTNDLGDAMTAATDGDWKNSWKGIRKTLYDANPFGNGAMGQRTTEAYASGIRDLGGIGRYFNDPTSFWNSNSQAAKARLDSWAPKMPEMPHMLHMPKF